jgi:hypothetical protein
MGAGLLMGLYAFDTSLPAPNTLVSYNHPFRRFIRLTHVNCIIFGLISIFLSRELEKKGIEEKGVMA